MRATDHIHYTCPDIDHVIDVIKATEKFMDEQSRSFQDSIDRLEDLRKANDELRKVAESLEAEIKDKDDEIHELKYELKRIEQEGK